MKEPSQVLLQELARALNEAEHKNVAEHMIAGVLWAIYPEWLDMVYRPTPRRVV